MSCLRRHLHLVPRLLDCIEVGLNLRGPQELNVDVVAQARQLCAVFVLFAAGTHELCPRYVNAATTTRRLASATTFCRGHWEDGAMFILLRVWSNRPRKMACNDSEQRPSHSKRDLRSRGRRHCFRKRHAFEPSTSKRLARVEIARIDRHFPELHTLAIHVDETRQCVLGGDAAPILGTRVAAEVDWKNDATGT